MKWYRISDYAITNGTELSGPENAYQHGTHIISMARVGSQTRYTLYQGDQMIAVRGSAEELKQMVKEVANEM